MSKSLCITLLAAGLVLTALGMGASGAFASDVARYFTGAPNNLAVWLLVSGVICTIVGAVSLAHRAHHHLQ